MVLSGHRYWVDRGVEWIEVVSGQRWWVDSVNAWVLCSQLILTTEHWGFLQNNLYYSLFFKRFCPNLPPKISHPCPLKTENTDQIQRKSVHCPHKTEVCITQRVLYWIKKVFCRDQENSPLKTVVCLTQCPLKAELTVLSLHWIFALFLYALRR